MAKKKRHSSGAIQNRRARFDYALSDSFVVGIMLNGRETKALRLGHGHLQGAYVTIKDGELWLINASIHGTQGIPIEDSEVTRTRKLLANNKEITQLIEAKNQGKTIVPTDILIKGRFIKLKISIGKGKKEYDKRQTIRKREDERSAQRLIRSKIS